MARPDGRRWHARLEYTALCGDSGLSVRTVISDITALKAAQREAEQRTAEAQLLNDELQTFLHTMTHDLTRPQRQMEGFVQLLSKSPTAPDARSAKLLGHLQEAAADRGEQVRPRDPFHPAHDPCQCPL